MNRYTLAGPWKAEPDTQGEWVLWRDVRSLVDAASEVAERHDHYGLRAHCPGRLRRQQQPAAWDVD